jgi:hypothetical protein
MSANISAIEASRRDGMIAVPTCSATKIAADVALDVPW